MTIAHSPRWHNNREGLLGRAEGSLGPKGNGRSASLDGLSHVPVHIRRIQDSGGWGQVRGEAAAREAT
jgi:hypothetical protein